MIYYFDESQNRLTEQPPEGLYFGPATGTGLNSQPNSDPEQIPADGTDVPAGSHERNPTPSESETQKQPDSNPEFAPHRPRFVALSDAAEGAGTPSDADFCDMFLLEIYVQNFMRASNHPEALLENKLGFIKSEETADSALYRYDFFTAPWRIDVRLSSTQTTPMNRIMSMTLADMEKHNEIRLPLTERGARYMLLRLYADANDISEASMIKREGNSRQEELLQTANQVRTDEEDLPPVNLSRNAKLGYLPPEAVTAAILSGTPFQSRKKTKTGLLKILLAGTTVTAATSIIVTALLALTVFRPLVTGETVQLAKPALRSQASQLFWASGYPKQQVDLCIVHSGWEKIDQCSTGSIGKNGDRVLWDLSMPSETYREAYPLVESVTVKDGRITVTAREDSVLEGINFILVPEKNSFNHVTWTIDPASTCRQRELC